MKIQKNLQLKILRNILKKVVDFEKENRKLRICVKKIDLGAEDVLIRDFWERDINAEGQIDREDNKKDEEYERF